MPPQTMRAIKIIAKGQGELQEVPLPQLRDNYVLCKVKSVALNPTDWKSLEGSDVVGCTSGCDFSGVVEEVGPGVTKQWKKGDRIAGFSHGGNGVQPEDGCFADYALLKGDIGMKVPDNVSDDEAATLGIGVTTVGQGLYQSLGLPLPGSGKFDKYLLVYGGSTATGTLAIQYAKLSGAKVITTCSPRNFPLVKKLGAEEAFDYKDPEVAAKIRAYTKDQLTHVFDTIAEGSSPTISEQSISSTAGGVISYLLPAKHTRTDVENKMTLGYTVIGEAFKRPYGNFPAKPEDFAFGRTFWQLSTKLFAEGQVVVHPPRVGKDGLKGVFEGLRMLKDGEVSGVKLVYRVDDTP